MSLATFIAGAFPLEPVPRAPLMEPAYLDPNSQGDGGATSCILGRSWKELSVPELSCHRAALYMFTPVAHAYYLPAFMLACIEQPEASGSIADDLLSHLSSYEDPFWARRIVALSPEQRSVVAGFVSAYYSEHVDGETVLRALAGLRTPLAGNV
jgi:hypothetical protein